MYSAVLFAFSAVILFEDKLRAVWTTAVLLGIGYLGWGFSQTRGVPDEKVTDQMMDWIHSGVFLIVGGLVLFGVWFIMDIRRRMPPQR